MDSIRTVLFWFATFCLGFTVLQYAALLLWAALSRQLLRQNRAGRRPVALATVATDKSMPGVSIIMPAYNEENVITHTTVSALAQEYPVPRNGHDNARRGDDDHPSADFHQNQGHTANARVVGRPDLGVSPTHPGLAHPFALPR